MRLVTLWSAIILSACGAPEAVLDPPSGTKAGEFTVSCPSDWDDCYKQAGKLCGSSGYREISEHEAEAVAMHSARLSPTDGWDLNTGPTDGIVRFRCN
jgi:hypothetical protein